MKTKPKKDTSFGNKLANLYTEFIKELDEYEKAPYRPRNTFWQRDESFEAFIHWVRHKYFL